MNKFVSEANKSCECHRTVISGGVGGGKNSVVHKTLVGKKFCAQYVRMREIECHAPPAR